ncbi:MAG: PBP1A family penicillin-binding protein [Chloroflexi bacterium]|nr:PBP1A family penicillin-binding protein [Chloroflexota bacterium]
MNPEPTPPHSIPTDTPGVEVYPVQTSRRPVPGESQTCPSPQVSDPPGAWIKRLAGCAVRLFAYAMLLLVLLLCLGIGGTFSVYAYYAATLPSPEALSGRTLFVSTKIFDRHGTLLYEVFDPTGGRRTIVPISRISPYLQYATVATEDSTFYSNLGVDPKGIARAFWQNLQGGEIVSGASTITQQVVKNALLSPEVTFERKFQEAVLALEVTRRYSKDDILAMYLNEIYYGNLAYGCEAAAETYFGKDVSQLSLAEASLLAGLPQAPAYYDPYTNLEAVKLRQRDVLRLMVRDGYISQTQADTAHAESLSFRPRRVDMKAPHFVVYVKQELERRYGTEILYRGGWQVITTLDLEYQDRAQRVAREHVTTLQAQGRDVDSAALVALRPDTGEILAMLGSVDYNDDAIDGQVNVTIRDRQPGSSIKPFTYVTGMDPTRMQPPFTPATLFADVRTELPGGAGNPPYVPRNYDDKFHGPMLLRTALGSSYNIPAVQALQRVGVGNMLDTAHRLGITSLNEPARYGLSLTLGGGEVKLLDMAVAYGVFANGGMMAGQPVPPAERVPGHRELNPVSILQITDAQGNVVERFAAPERQQVLDPRLAYLVTSILSDNEARTPAFGPNNIFVLGRPAAVKTGTTDQYRDSWTIGYTPDLVAGVWVGNPDGRPMKGVPGSQGAGVIWRNFMVETLADIPAREFFIPAGLVSAEVCAVSGMRPTADCPRRIEIFLNGTAPTQECTIHQRLAICRVSGELATGLCPPGDVEEKLFEAYGPEFGDWPAQQGIPSPPTTRCHIHDFAPEVLILLPNENETVIAPVTIWGTTQVPLFRDYAVYVGAGDDPPSWFQIAPHQTTPALNQRLAEWDAIGLAPGRYTIRLVVTDQRGNLTEARVHMTLVQPTPTPTATVTPTVTTTPSATPTVIVEPTGTPTPTPTLPPPTPPVPTLPPVTKVPPPPTEGPG